MKKILLLILLTFGFSRNMISVNPLGLLMKNGVSSISYETSMNEFTYMSYRLDLWTVEENDEYEESSTLGIGLGINIKEFIFSNNDYSGLYYGYGFDMLYMKYEDKNLSTNCSSNCIEKYSGYTMAPYMNWGISLGFSNIRINPSIAFAYAYIYDEVYEDDFEILIIPEVHFCYFLD